MRISVRRGESEGKRGEENKTVVEKVSIVVGLPTKKLSFIGVVKKTDSPRKAESGGSQQPCQWRRRKRAWRKELRAKEKSSVLMDWGGNHRRTSGYEKVEVRSRRHAAKGADK